MKKTVYIIIGMWALASCQSKNLNVASETGSSSNWSLIPDSTEYYALAESYPDSITVAFTRDGVFEDSAVVYKYGFIKNAPAYVLKAAVGDMWVYNSNGEFVEFMESPQPHSDQGHTYNP